MSYQHKEYIETPTESQTITANGTYDVTEKASAIVNVSASPTLQEKFTVVNGEVTPDSGYDGLSKVTVNVPTGTARTSSDLTASGATVTVPAGLYSTQATKLVASGTLGTVSATKGTVSNNSVSVTPSISAGTAGYNEMAAKSGTAVTVSASELVDGNKAITATTSTQTDIDVTNYATVSVVPTPSETKSVTTNGDVTPTSGKLLSKVTVNVPTGTARSSSDLTVSGATVTVPAGLYSEAASKSVASGSATTPATTKQQSQPSISVSSAGLITASVAATSVSVTPTVSAGYVSAGTAGTVTMSANSNTKQLTTQAATTITPSTSSQTAVASGVYTTGAVTVAAIPNQKSDSGNVTLDASTTSKSYAAGYYANAHGAQVTVYDGSVV